MPLPERRAPSSGTAALDAGDRLRREGRVAEAVDAYLAAAVGTELPPAPLCLRLARGYRDLKDELQARRWAAAVVDCGDDFTSWHAAATLVQSLAPAPGAHLRSVRLALLGSYTTAQLGLLLRLAALRRGILLDIQECAYGQYRQEILDPASATYRFDPAVVLLAVHEAEVGLPPFSDAPAADVTAELSRWTGLWDGLRQRTSARIVQHNFAIPPEVPLGHLAARTPGSRYRMVQELNHELGEAAGPDVSIVDCDRLSALVGKRTWFDARYWHHARQAVGLGALPLLARHTAAVIGADLGMTRKCLVLDLDNTLWGGVIGEDGLAGIRLGNGVDGEAYVAFQQYVARLKETGVILAVCSQNNDHDAREPFRKHPEMRLRLEDFAVFVANWQSKAENLRAIARTLDLGLDALVFVDDNPAEREVIRQQLPEVDVVPLPDDPARFVRCLSDYLHFERTSFTGEDRQRTAHYHARARIGELEAGAASLEEFHRSLRMQAMIRPFEEVDLPRIVQLIGKTNQFNLTTRRHGLAQLRSFMNDPDCVHFSLRLRDRFADHGLVAVLIGFRRGDVLDIDTLLMSCRVIGRTVEAEMLEHLCNCALELGCTMLRGTFIPTSRNAVVSELYARLGFTLVEEEQGTAVWSYDIEACGPIRNEFIAADWPCVTHAARLPGFGQTPPQRAAGGARSHSRTPH